MRTNYDEKLDDMLIDCRDWDSEVKALTEAFNQGIDFQKKYGEKK